MTAVPPAPDEREQLRGHLRRWRDDLIDMTKRNRLLWFRATGTTTFELRQPGLREIYARTMKGGSWGFFMPPQQAESAPALRPPGEDELVTDKSDSAVVRRGLVSLERRVTQTFMESGLWVLHVGLGMLRWRALDDSEDAHSPLLLVPVTVERSSPREPFRLRRAEGDLVLNPALAVKLQADFGVTLPALDDPEDSEIDAVFAGVSAACRQWPDWSIEERAVLATFSFQKEAMYRDLLENEEMILGQPAVRVLGLGRDETGGFAFSPVPESELDEAMPPEKLASILDADASQRQCIKAGVDGRSFVMDGPPGTGKSQTIANLIAELISRGQTVLFVSEKAAALDVVQSRLAVAGLGEFLLPLHSHKATRKGVAIELGRALATQPLPGPRLEVTALDRLRQRRQALTAYVEAMNELRRPLARTLHAAYGRISLLHKLPRVAWWSGAVADLSVQRFNEILDAARGLARAWGPVERRTDFLWRDLDFGRTDMQLVHEIAGELQACGDALGLLRAEARSVADAVGLDWAASQIGTADLVDLGRRLIGRPVVPPQWLWSPQPELVLERLRELEPAWGEVDRGVDELRALVGPGWRQLGTAGHAVVVEAMGVCLGLPIAWRVPAFAGALELARMQRLAATMLEQLPWIEVQASRLAQTFGGAGGGMTLRQASALAELGRMAASPHRPQAAWLSPMTLPSLGEAARVLGALIEQYRARRAELAEVFTDGVLALDLETLCPRFEQVYRGPFKFFKGGYRADRGLLASATRLGRVDARVRTNLRDALEWQRLTQQLDLAESQHAGVIGSHYYQREQTDFQALTDAVENAHRAVQLAGNRLDPAMLSRQLAVEGAPDHEVVETARDLWTRVSWVVDEAQAVIPESVVDLLDAPLAEVAEAAKGALAPLQGLDAVLAGVADVTGRPSTLQEARRALELRVRMADSEAALTASEVADRDLLGPGYDGHETDWPALRGAVDWATDLLRLTGQVGADTAGRLVTVRVDPEELRARLIAWEETVDSLLSRFQRDHGARLRERLISNYEDAAALLERMSLTLGDIDEWLQHVRWRDELESAGLAATISDCLRLELPAGQVVELVERALLEGWANEVAQADSRLREVRSRDRDRLVEEFRELDRELIRRAAANVIERCNELRPQSTVGQAGIIQAQASLRRRHKPIRRLLTEAGDVARRLKPCFMMSPLSVSSFLPPNFRFDVVVFDEASQVRPCDAINCVYRGDRMIVAGDQKQLPPTSFFDARVQAGDEMDDDSESVQDFDSILDQCKGSGFPSLSLQWHYRSQHESLIAFSNASFYDRSLLTFPGAIAQAADLGVELYQVNGVYRGSPHNDNPVEAEKVAERVMWYAEHSATREKPLSVGVVTFSDAQEERVLATIENARSRRPDLDSFFRADRLNGFFVKNLESVQGDERDVMIFSVGYAYDADGRFALRMGPLTADGGQRRLNVAVTRARRRVEVVGSVGPEDFRGQIREGGGVWHLRRYLAYVARGGILDEVPTSTGRTFDSELEESVARALQSWGYEVVPQVGMARYRIDLGVRTKDDPSRFLLGVECDGAMYHSSRVARDRDRLRHSVLTGLGWKLHRIWSPAWYRDRHAEEQRLRAALQAAEDAAPTIPIRREEAPEQTPVPEIRVVELEPEGPPPWTVPYLVAHPVSPRYRVEMHLSEAAPDLQRMTMEVVETEGPVAVDLALRRVREAWGVGRAGSQIQANFLAQLEKLQSTGRLRLIGDFIWPASGELQHVRVPDPPRTETERGIEQVPPQEIDLAMAHIAAAAIAAPEDELTENVARLFGWRRRGPDISAKLVASVERLYHAGRLQRAGEVMRWVGEPPPGLGGRTVTDRVVPPRQPEEAGARPVPRPPKPVRPSWPLQPRPPLSSTPTRPVRPASDTPDTPDTPATSSQPTASRPALPADIDRCLTADGMQERMKELQRLESQLDLARLGEDGAIVASLQSRIQGLKKLLQEIRVIPQPAHTRSVSVGCVVAFREINGPEETFQLVPPLEADGTEAKMSVLTPLGQALLGRSVGDLVDVGAPGGDYMIEIIGIKLP